MANNLILLGCGVSGATGPPVLSPVTSVSVVLVGVASIRISWSAGSANTSYTVKIEMQINGGAWTLLSDGSQIVGDLAFNYTGGNDFVSNPFDNGDTVKARVTVVHAPSADTDPVLSSLLTITAHSQTWNGNQNTTLATSGKFFTMLQVWSKGGSGSTLGGGGGGAWALTSVSMPVLPSSLTIFSDASLTRITGNADIVAATAGGDSETDGGAGGVATAFSDDSHNGGGGGDLFGGGGGCAGEDGENGDGEAAGGAGGVGGNGGGDGGAGDLAIGTNGSNPGGGGGAGSPAAGSGGTARMRADWLTAT